MWYFRTKFVDLSAGYASTDTAEVVALFRCDRHEEGEGAEGNLNDDGPILAAARHNGCV